MEPPPAVPEDKPTAAPRVRAAAGAPPPHHHSCSTSQLRILVLLLAKYFQKVLCPNATTSCSGRLRSQRLNSLTRRRISSTLSRFPNSLQGHTQASPSQRWQYQHTLDAQDEDYRRLQSRQTMPLQALFETACSAWGNRSHATSLPALHTTPHSSPRR